MVPVHKRQHAHDVRIQIIRRDGDASALLLAFLEQFALTEAMCFKLLITDAFERVDGGADGRGKRLSEKEMGGAKWGVKLIDAKFSLPSTNSEKRDKGVGIGGEEEEGEERGWRKHRRKISKDKDSGRDSRNGVDGREEDDGRSRKGKIDDRFVCVDMLEYPGEHDDIVIGFEEETGMLRFLSRKHVAITDTGRAERDAFLDALPAAPQVSRGINLRRKF